MEIDGSMTIEVAVRPQYTDIRYTDILLKIRYKDIPLYMREHI